MQTRQLQGRHGPFFRSAVQNATRILRDLGCSCRATEKQPHEARRAVDER